MLAAGPDGRDDLSKLVSCCLSDLVKRPQTCGSGDVPKLLDLSQEVEDRRHPQMGLAAYCRPSAAPAWRGTLLRCSRQMESQK